MAARLRATESYVFTSDDLVGKGATCEVYKGINKVLILISLVNDSSFLNVISVPCVLEQNTIS